MNIIKKLKNFSSKAIKYPRIKRHVLRKYKALDEKS